MEDLEHFYNRVLTYKNLIKLGYFDVTKDKGNKHEDVLWGGPYSNQDAIFDGYFNLYNFVENDDALEFAIDKVRTDKVKNKKETTPIEFSIPKKTGSRRLLKYPNIYSYCDLVFLLVSHKEEIINKLIEDNHSISKFLNYSPYGYEVTKRIKDKILFGHTLYFKTDFAAFYPSFYTHAISWLIQGKEYSKLNRRSCKLGNLIDKKVELEQNGETHGLPTGSLATRIIVEYMMAFFDEQLDRQINDSSKSKIDFYRYVDDIYFAYDTPEQLVKIKVALRELTDKYGITINDRKTKGISLEEVQENTQLINWFPQKENKILSKKKFYQRFVEYFTVANNELINGVKGTKKLLFLVLKSYLKNLSPKNQENAISALTYTYNNQIEYPFIAKLVQIALNDSSVGSEFIQLLDQLQQIDVIDKVRKTLVDIIDNNSKDDKLFNKLLLDIELNQSQETYFILLLYQKLELGLSTTKLNKIFSIIDQTKKIDDFNMIILIKLLISNLKEDRLDLLLIPSTYNPKISFDEQEAENLKLESEVKNDIKQLSPLIAIIYKLLLPNRLDKNDYSTYFSRYFTYEHWLLRYECMYMYENDSEFQNLINEYVKQEGAINIFDRNFVINKFKSNYNDFFDGLLERGVSFTLFKENVEERTNK